MAFYFIKCLPPQIVSGSGGGGGGVTIAYRDRPLPKIRIKLVKENDLHSNINITILKVVDMSLTGGKE